MKWSTTFVPSKLKLNCQLNLSTRKTHTQNMSPWFYICIFFPYNDTVVDAQIFEIFFSQQSILDVFLNQHPLICSSTVRILICKNLKNTFNVRKCFHFEKKDQKHLYWAILNFHNYIMPFQSAILSNDGNYLTQVMIYLPFQSWTLLLLTITTSQNSDFQA